jgi:hypothetical protein
MPKPPPYPPPRVRPALPPTTLDVRFERQETTRGFVTLSDSDTDVIRFSGEVDSVEVFVETFGAILTFTDRDNVELDTITLRVNTTYSARYACSVVRARNAVGGSNATVQVIGRWARRSGMTGATTEESNEPFRPMRYPPEAPAQP